MKWITNFAATTALLTTLFPFFRVSAQSSPEYGLTCSDAVEVIDTYRLEGGLEVNDWFEDSVSLVAEASFLPAATMGKWYFYNATQYPANMEISHYTDNSLKVYIIEDATPTSCAGRTPTKELSASTPGSVYTFMGGEKLMIFVSSDNEANFELTFERTKADNVACDTGEEVLFTYDTQNEGYAYINANILWNGLGETADSCETGRSPNTEQRLYYQFQGRGSDIEISLQECLTACSIRVTELVTCYTGTSCIADAMT